MVLERLPSIPSSFHLEKGYLGFMREKMEAVIKCDVNDTVGLLMRGYSS